MKAYGYDLQLTAGESRRFIRGRQVGIEIPADGPADWKDRDYFRSIMRRAWRQSPRYVAVTNPEGEVLAVAGYDDGWGCPW